jgi:hypothetical protein
MGNTRILMVLSCLMLVALTQSACDVLPGIQPGEKPLTVPLPTYGTNRPPSATRLPGTNPPQITRAPSPTADPDFWSNGNWIQGWWWIRDNAYQNTANWMVIIPAGTGDITLNLTVLATAQANGGRGASAVFFLSYGQKDGPIYGRKMVELPNTSPASDPVGYTCTGTFTLTRAEIKNATQLWLKTSRKDDLNEFPSTTVHVAFNKQSIVVRK